MEYTDQPKSMSLNSHNDYIIYPVSGCTDVRFITTIGIGSSYGDRYLGINHFRDSRCDTNLLDFFFKPDLRMGDIVTDESPIVTGAFRKYVKITIINSGRALAENCDAKLTLITYNSTSQLQPSPRDKNLVWDNGEYYRTIGAKGASASVNVVFSQSSFANPQSGVEKIIEESKKIYAKVATIHSLNNLDIGNIQFAEDGMGIDDTYFRLSVKSITGQDTEATLKVSVTNNWHDLSIVKVT